MASFTVLETLVVRLVANTTGYTNSLDAAVRHTMAAASMIENRVTRMGRAFLGAGALLTASLTAPIVGLGAAAVREFTQFDHVMTTSTAVMGGVTKEARQMMEATADAISAQSISAPTELAHAYFVLASAGFDAQHAIGALAQVEKFAVAGAFDMENGFRGSSGQMMALRKATSLLVDAQTAL